MRRSRSGFGRRLFGSRKRAGEIRLPDPGTRQVLATPSGSGRLSEGVVVETDIVATLLGVRALRLQGTVVLAPADVRADPAGGGVPSYPVFDQPSTRSVGQWVADSPAPGTLGPAVPDFRPRPAGGGALGSSGSLADAVRLLRESESTLARARREQAGPS